MRMRFRPPGSILSVFVIAVFVLTRCALAQESPPTEGPINPTEVATADTDQVVEQQGDRTPESEELMQETSGADQDQVDGPDCGEQRGRVERVEYSSQLLGEYIPVLVYLPPCYLEERQYPALYLLHGKPQDENHWLILGIKEAVDSGISSGEMAELLLVMPYQPEPLFTQTDGGAGSYEGEFVSALMPFVEARYSVSPLNEKRALAGISRGGVWALEIAFTHPEQFRGVGALSPALNVNDARPEFDPFELAHSDAVLPGRIFLASGDIDSAAGETKRLHQILAERGVGHRYTTAPGGHEGTTWMQLIGEMLDYLTMDW